MPLDGSNHIPTTPARQAYTTGRVRYILAISLGAAIVALGACVIAFSQF